MEYTRLGNTGLEVSEVCFGTWRFGKESDGVLETDKETAHELLDACAEHGVNFIDTANGYGGGDSERWIGEWLAEQDREEYVIASKVYWSQVSRFSENLSRKNIRAEIEGTLDRLGTDYLDLYYIHRFDDDTPILETMRTLNDLVREGTVHYLGASSMAAWKLTKALWASDAHDLERFDVTQPRFSATDRESADEYLDVCADQDLAVCPWSPLDRGFLSGKYTRDGEVPDGSRATLEDWWDPTDYSDEQWATLDAVRQAADELDEPTAAVALRWLIERPQFTCVPIVGARTTEQLAENVRAGEFELSDEQRERITQAYEGHGDD